MTAGEERRGAELFSKEIRMRLTASAGLLFWGAVLAGCAREPSEKRVMSSTEKVRAYYERQAPRYDRRIRLAEKLFFGEGRRWAASQATGDVLEVAIGTGRNLRFYPGEARVTGIDISPKMTEIARRRALELGREVKLEVGDAQALAFPDESFDTVVCTLSLCCIPDDRRAVKEMKRVLRPGGRLVLLDHVSSDMTVVRAMQRLLEPLWNRVHSESLLRHPLKLVREEGFEIEWHERSRWGIVERVLARKPASQLPLVTRP